MKKKNIKLNPSGIYLEAPRLIVQKSSAAAGFMLHTLLVLLGVFGTILCPVTAFNLPVYSSKLILYTLLFIVVLSAVFHLKRVRHFILFGFVLLYIAAGYYWRTELLQGYMIAANRIFEVYTKQSGYCFPGFVTITVPQYEPYCTMFMLSVAFFLTYFLCWAIITQRSFLLTFAATFPFLLGSLVFSIVPQFYAVLLLCACWATLIFMRLPTGDKEDFEKKRGFYRAKNNRAAVRGGTLILPILLLCFALILTLFPQQSYKRPNDVLRNKITDTIKDISLFNSYEMAGNPSRVDLSTTGSIQFTGKTMLQIQSSENYPMYLKGFAGIVYNGSSWETLPDSEYTAISKKLDGINAQNMSFHYSINSSLPADFQLRPYSIHVKNIGASKQCIYAPYNLTTTPENITGVKYINDSVIKSASIFGINEYSLYAYNLSRQEISPFDVYLGAIGENRQKYSKAAQAYLAGQNKYSALNAGNLASYYKGTVPEDVLTTLNTEKRSFVRAEQDYRLFLYDKYTQLPSNIKTKVLGLLKKEKMNTSYGSVYEMASAVTSYLAKTCSYTLSPGKTPQGRDFTEYFLFENHKGYCVHFATAATVMLRAMGVPARYAEGYIVTNNDYSIGGFANVKDNRAHAWVEVYCPGLGWQPIEATPGFSAAENRIEDKNPEDYSYTESHVESTPASAVSSKAASSSPQSSTPQSTASSQTAETPLQTNDTRTAATPILISIAFMAVLIVAAATKRRIAITSRTKLFGLKSTNKAAIGVYRYLQRLTQFGGEIEETIIEIALKAKFSQHQISDDELQTMINYAEATARKLYRELPRGKRVLFKYFYNLI